MTKEEKEWVLKTLPRKEDRVKVFAFELGSLAVSAAFADDTETERCIERVAFAKGVKVYD